MEEQQQQPLCALEPAEVTKPAITRTPKLELQNDDQYADAISVCNLLVDTVGDDESHPLFPMTNALMDAIYDWENQPSGRMRDEVAKSDDANSQKGVDV